MEQKIKQNGIDIGGNIRRIRLEKGCWSDRAGQNAPA